MTKPDACVVCGLPLDPLVEDIGTHHHDCWNLSVSFNNEVLNPLRSMRDESQRALESAERLFKGLLAKNQNPEAESHDQT